jgi:hypothetical protein
VPASCGSAAAQTKDATGAVAEEKQRAKGHKEPRACTQDALRKLKAVSLLLILVRATPCVNIIGRSDVLGC